MFLLPPPPPPLSNGYFYLSNRTLIIKTERDKERGEEVMRFRCRQTSYRHKVYVCNTTKPLLSAVFQSAVQAIGESFVIQLSCMILAISTANDTKLRLPIMIDANKPLSSLFLKDIKTDGSSRLGRKQNLNIGTPMLID